ncbi:MAG TPA: hypothetical protein VM689_11695 [Aliidongia sp.]|nr:hypothetical protein [Aliidongia sp.]
MATWLKRLRVKEVSLVDRPACPGADIILSKRDDGEDFILVGNEAGQPTGIICKRADATLCAYGPEFLTPEIVAHFQPTEPVDIGKVNPNHGPDGRFVSGDGAGSAGPDARRSLLGRLVNPATGALAGAAAGALLGHAAGRAKLFAAVAAAARHPATREAARRAAAAAASPAGRQAAESLLHGAVAAGAAGRTATAVASAVASGVLSGIARFSKGSNMTKFGKAMGDDGDDFAGTSEDTRDDAQKAEELRLLLEHAAANPASTAEPIQQWLDRIFGREGAGALHGDERAALIAMRRHFEDKINAGRAAEGALVAKGREIAKAEHCSQPQGFARAAARFPELYATLRAHSSPIQKNDVEADDAADALDKRAREIAKATGCSSAKAFSAACAARPDLYQKVRRGGRTAEPVTKSDDGGEAQQAAGRIRARAAELSAGASGTRLSPAQAFSRSCQEQPGDYHVARLGRAL